MYESRRELGSYMTVHSSLLLAKKTLQRY